MKSKFLVSTTNNIEGSPILKYMDVVCSNVVIGANIFSDFSASLTDFFGGYSDSYKRKLENIYNEAYKELKQKAISLGANAIIGFKVDFDEISGKDKSMFMISASGTACIIDKKENDAYIEENNNGLINQFNLDREIDRRFIISKINKGASIENKWVEFLLENPQIEIIENILDRYFDDFGNYNAYKEEIEIIERLILALPKNKVIPKVYDRLATPNNAIAYLIEQCNLFDARSILALCDSNPHTAIRLLSAKSDYYSFDDLEAMTQIARKLASLPDTGKIELVKSGILGKEQEKFICENGHKSAPDSEFCDNNSCGLNRKGLTCDEVKQINQFNEKTEILTEMFDQQRKSE